jgi:hypothetical protein
MMNGSALRIAPFLGLALLAPTGCQKPAAPAASSTAEKPKPEPDPNKTTITAAARASLGVRSAPVEARPAREQTTLAGWVQARPGAEVTLTAPVAGYVRAGTVGGLWWQPRRERGAPFAGEAVAAGESLFLLEPVLAPLDQVQILGLRRAAAAEVAKAEEARKVAREEQTIAEAPEGKQVKGQVRYDLELSQARAKLKNAEEDLAAAQYKARLFDETAEGDARRLRPVPVQAPRSGVAVNVLAAPGQYVAAAAPLLTVVDLSRPWLRVSVPEADLHRIDRTAPATAILHAVPFDYRLTARPVPRLVPQVDPARLTADLYYELPALPPHLPPLGRDQMLTVLVPRGEERTETVVPTSAVVYDSGGGAWVYVDLSPDERADPQTFERRPVEIGAAVEGGVVIRPGLPKNSRVVVAGAAALFSREFHSTPMK